ncbi:MAG: aminopeptidase [Chitinivibrionales bacterium]|nr:aminopeptidase [Chitinivibrionales bacterium]MBD3356882.1 aminopeptidase [Chitinivibrionales bacterium]
MNVTVSKAPKTTTHILFVDTNEAINIADFEGKKETVAVRYEGDKTLIYAGMGDKRSCSLSIIRGVAAKAVKTAAGLKRTKVALLEPTLPEGDDTATRACLEGAILGSYIFDKYRSEKSDRLKSIEVVSTRMKRTEAQAIAQVCECVGYVRDLVNDNASVVNPQYLAKEARKLSRSSKRIATTILDEKELRDKGLGLLSAVGQGSPYPPRLIIMEYRGNARNKETSAIVGKGITFDSGGQDLKARGHIETMRTDMAGAGAVLGIMKALTLLQPSVNVIGVVTAAHNAIDGTSYFPGDIYRAYNGKTVEIANTDAEGRLALADALSYLQKHYKPSKIIDLATLTGGVLSALGSTVAAVISNSDALADSLFAVGERTGERLWRLPLYEEHSDSLKSEFADLRNTSTFKRGHASTITAAAFIKEFIGDLPWAHLDIAGTAFNQGEARGEIPKNATGFGVRLVYEYLVGSGR